MKENNSTPEPMHESSEPVLASAASQRLRLRVLLGSIFVIASCSIFYELLISTVSTYFMGNSIMQFSITIGVFMFSMGIGSYLSRYALNNLLQKFIAIEIALGFLGGGSTLILHFCFAYTESYMLLSIVLIVLIGTLIGLEIPLLTRIVNRQATIKDAVAMVFSFDYVGALLASVLFPLVLLPLWGSMKTSFAIGLLNLLVALASCYFFKQELRQMRRLAAWSLAGLGCLLAGMVYAVQLTGFFEESLFQDDIIFARQTPYQRLVVTRWNEDYRLYINGNLQFSSIDEHRYHEPLVNIPLLLSHNKEKVLILGGGDGLALREVLKYKEVKQVDLVDLDPEMTSIAARLPFFTRLNHNSLSDSRVKVHPMDAFNYVRSAREIYSVIIADLPDPNDTGLGKLYTREFYLMCSKILARDGVMVTQATSPYFSRESFWCIDTTMGAAFGNHLPYTVNVPSFGQWGFVLAGGGLRQFSGCGLPAADTVSRFLARKLAERGHAGSLRFLSPQVCAHLFAFDPDCRAIPATVNRLDNQSLVQYYEKSLKNWR